MNFKIGFEMWWKVRHLFSMVGKGRYFFILSIMSFLCCGRADKIFVVAPENATFIKEIIDGLEDVELAVCSEPKNCLKNGINIVVEEIECEECFEMEVEDNAIVLRGGFPLGVIYGITHLLEEAGFRFPHPFYSVHPDSISKDRFVKSVIQISGKRFEPEIPLRGLHLHTLHPIETLFSFWIPSENGLKEAKDIIRWLVRMRGNYIQWVALNDIQKNDNVYKKWKDYTEEIVNYAHYLGVKTGINTELFSQSSFQNAYLSVTRKDVENILSIPFDHINLSFGEFIGENPDTFIQALNGVYEMIKEIAPPVEVSTTVHVGNFDNLWVEYNGERILYYFLVKYANSNLIPLIHTVMYYNLFDDAGGAYNHSDFSLHREFLFELLRSNRKAGYHPETAYWIAFDNSVPIYLPIYVISRWLDLNGIFSQAKNLYAHIIFSSGWEWGYWLNDYSSLKFSYTLPVTWTEPVYEIYGEDYGEIVKNVAEVEYRYLIGRRLAPYLSGEDFYIYLGCGTRLFFSQPCRVSFQEVLSMDEPERVDFNERVLKPLKDFEEELHNILNSVEWEDIPLIRELKDGIEITYLRAHFIRLLYTAVLEKGQSLPSFRERLDEAIKIFEKAWQIISRRHQNLFYPRSELLISSVSNPTIYPYGYLKQAHTMCLWERDLKTAKLVLGEKTGIIPLCIF